jgi:hypothetical protein
MYHSNEICGYKDMSTSYYYVMMIKDYGHVWFNTTSCLATLVAATGMMACVCLACHVCRLCPPLQCDCDELWRSNRPPQPVAATAAAWRGGGANQTCPKVQPHHLFTT